MNNTDITNISTDTSREASRSLSKILRRARRAIILAPTCGFMALTALGSCQSTGQAPVKCVPYNPPYGALFGYDFHHDSSLDIGVWNFPNGKRMGYAQQEDSIIYRSAACAKRSAVYNT